MMPVSLVITVKNEGQALPRLFESIVAQTRRPDEIVVADAGSTDRTKAVLEEYAFRLNLVVLDCPGANISQGRNAAIARAHGPIIASTDAGVRLDERWLEEIAKPIESNVHAADVVSGFFLPDPHGAFETALAATTLPALRDIKADGFLPSSRSIAFRRSAWEEVGGYPDWLDYSEDLIFDFSLRAAGCRFVFAPQARVYFRPRSRLSAFARQYYLYARGDGKADLWRKRHGLRYLTYLLGLPVTLALAARRPAFALPIWLLALFVLFHTPYRRLIGIWGDLGDNEKLEALAWVPIIRTVGDVAKMVGYPVGVWWRTNRH